MPVVALAFDVARRSKNVDNIFPVGIVSVNKGLYFDRKSDIVGVESAVFKDDFDRLSEA